jgi:hypothetical protein
MEMAKKLALMQSNEVTVGQFQTATPPAYDLNGTKLSTGTQHLFYRAIKSKRRKPERMKTHA